MAKPGLNSVTPFVGGTPVFPNTNLAATPGSASAAVEWTDVADVTVAAPITVAADNTIGHAASGVTPGTYGDSTHYPVVTVEADGHVTAASQQVVPTPPVTSVFGRTGAVVAAPGDYTVAQVTGAAPLASPALTGSPTAPTQTPGDNTTKIATDAFVQAAISAGGFLPEAGGTMTGRVTIAGLNFTVTLVNDANYTATASDNIIIYTALTTNRFVAINAGLPAGQLIFIADGSGHAVTGTKEIQVGIGAGVTFNGNTLTNPIHAITYNGGMAILFNSGVSDAWIITGNNWPLWVPTAGGATVTYNGGAVLGGNWTFQDASAEGVIMSTHMLMVLQTHTISATLTLASSATNFQAINGGAADRIVNFAFTSGDWFWFYNTGTTNNLLLTTNSALVYSLPPGRSVILSYNGSAFKVWAGQGPLSQRNIDLTTQGAALGATTLLTTASNGAGVYRVSWSAVVTQAATASSVLGGTNGFQVTYTDNDTGASTTPLAEPSASGTGNTIGTQVSGTVIVNAKASTAIQVQFDYTSTGITPMQYALHIRSEYLN